MHCKVWKHSIALLCCAALVLVPLTACGEAKKSDVRFFSMDTIMEITAYGECGDALRQARARIEALDALLNANDSQSAVSNLQNGDLLDADLLLPLQTAQQVSDATDGALDVTLYPLSAEWGFYSKQYHVPSAETIRTLLQSRGVWSIDGGCLQCTDGIRFDLGSVAKGYAAQCAAEVLRQNGVESAVLALGGNVQTLGKKPNGEDWSVSVADPQRDGEIVGTLHVGECALVTSGSYQRFFTENGETYHHILDPATGYPARSGLLSVTVLCADGTTADALSTALFIKGMPYAAQLYTNHLFSFEALFITEDREVWLTEGLRERFEQTNDSYASYQVL